MKETALVKSPEKYTWCVYESERDQVLRHRNGKTKHTLTKGKKFGHRLSRSKKYTRVIVPELGPTVVFTMTHKQLENLMKKSKVQKGRKPKMQRDRRQVVSAIEMQIARASFGEKAEDMYTVEEPKTARGNPMNKRFNFKRDFLGKYEQLHLTGKEIAMMEALLKAEGGVEKGALLKELYPGGDEPELKIIEVFGIKVNKKLRGAGAPGRIYEFAGNDNAARYIFSKVGKVPIKGAKVVGNVPLTSQKEDTEKQQKDDPQLERSLKGKQLKLYSYLKQLGKPVDLNTVAKQCKCSTSRVISMAKNINKQLGGIGSNWRIANAGEKGNKKAIKLQLVIGKNV